LRGLGPLRRAFRWGLKTTGEVLPVAPLGRGLAWIASWKARSSSPEEGLRFLLGLEAALYPLEGELAVAYGGGLHTKHRHMRYHEFFASRIRPGERVLDLGCGVGAVAERVAELSEAHVVGVDKDPRQIQQARAHHAHPRVDYRVGDALREPLDGPFDAVILSNVLEHVEERVELLRRVGRSAPSARMLIRVPLFERDWRVPLRRELGVEWRLDLTHRTEYTLDSFAEELSAAGLRVIHQEVRWGEIWAEAVWNG
jgi:SAM-dependent methyltransferase